MKIIGITGGIGSGKSVISNVFKVLGIPIFDSDLEAKKLYKNEQVLTELVQLFGNEILTENEIDFTKLAEKVFNNSEKLDALNKLIHPKLQLYFNHWCAQQKHCAYVIKEAAILIESGSYKQCDEIILVTSNLELRINRVMKRSGLSRENVLARINKQLSDTEKEKYVQHQLMNDEQQLLIPQILKLHKGFLL